MAHENLHEDRTALSKNTQDMHRAIISLIEELEAVDWYNQRADVCEDQDLQAILIHNRDEEKEHAAMLIEWLRRTDKRFSKELEEYLFSEKDIVDQEKNR
ncbi:MAG: hypothetical protein KQH63_07630 [Desulfobulbaceae bacterium]|nr:hypothetical protein [Desulfobulbaceae bacterium]